MMESMPCEAVVAAEPSVRSPEGVPPTESVSAPTESVSAPTEPTARVSTATTAPVAASAVCVRRCAAGKNQRSDQCNQPSQLLHDQVTSCL